MAELLGRNLWSWTVQTFLIAALGSLLPLLFRLRHPRTQLAYYRALLLACLLLPLIEPWRHPIVTSATAQEGEPSAGTAPAIENSIRTEAQLPGSVTPPPRLTQTPRSPARAQLPWTRVVLWGLAAGATGRLCWLLAGIWRIRQYRIAAMPLYPIPESVRAASAITHADALFCISADAPGPATLGWLAPVVLLPESFLALGDEAQCGIACHELIHVRRHDWAISILEQIAAALLWFNPAIWLLLARTGLMREQVVDAETVRLTAAKESYIDALLAIARGGPVSDLAPAPLFLRRRHLTHRMRALIKEVPMSRLRLLFSYCSIAPILAFAGWFAFLAFPLVGSPRVEAAVQEQSAPTTAGESMIAANQTPTPLPRRIDAETGAVDSVPVPPDPREPVSRPIRVVETAADRAAVIALLERATQNAKMHLLPMRGYSLKASFLAGGDAAYTGSGELTETWLSGRSWRWTASLGGFSIVRVGSEGQLADESHVAAVPMRIQMLRDAIFWAAGRTAPSNAAIRTAAVELNGQPGTCVLTSQMGGAIADTRLWEETEYCVDNASGLLRIYSIAPGTYAVYDYGRNLQFHGRLIPDRITVTVGGTNALEAQVGIAEAGAVDPGLLTVTQEMTAGKPAVVLSSAIRFSMDVPDFAGGGAVRPVIVHAIIDPSGKVIEEEVSAAADPALAQPALDLVKKHNFGSAGDAQRDAYINVRFGAPAQ